MSFRLPFLDNIVEHWSKNVYFIAEEHEESEKCFVSDTVPKFHFLTIALQQLLHLELK